MIFSPRFKGMDLRILIGTPSMGIWPAQFGISLANMMAVCHSHRIEEASSQSVQFMHTQGSLLPNMRWEMIEFAKKIRAHYLLFIDSDHSFPRKTLHKLLSHHKDCVAANCVTKTLPPMPTAREKVAGDWKGRPIYSNEKVGLEKVWRVGTGVMLLSEKAYRAIPKEGVEMRWHPSLPTIVGEDWNMGDCLEKAGIDEWVDHDLSKEIGHIGWLDYQHHMIPEEQYNGQDEGSGRPNPNAPSFVPGPFGQQPDSKGNSWEGDIPAGEGEGLRRFGT